ncbi:hypothetical protein Tco_0999576 [Tanacetum coccineum]
MAFSIISISSNSSEESVETSTTRVILFGMIPTTIPSTTPTTDLPIILDDTLDTPDLPQLQDPYEAVVARWRSRVVARLSPPSSPIHKILPTPLGLPLRLAVLVFPGQPIHVESSSSDSSLRHSSSGYAISDSLDDSSTTSSAMPYRKRCRSSTSSVPAVLPIRGALSQDSYEPYVPREAGLGFDVKDSYEPYTETNIDYDIQADIDECITYADAIRAKRTDDRDVVETTVEEDVESKERET